MMSRSSSVELPDGERVTGPHVVQSGDQARPVPAAPGEGERVALELGVLDVGAPARLWLGSGDYPAEE